MKAFFLVGALAFCAGAACAAEPADTVTVSVDLTHEKGAIRLMNAVNGGPTVKKPGGDQKLGNFAAYRAARIPFARTHDCVSCVSGGAHACDISAVFPDFEADETDPKNYDFVFTDHYLDSMRRAGTEVFFRLGETIEHGPKKYGILPPKDFGKWARICEHVIRHYNEGWGWGADQSYGTKNIAWSNQFNIVYWEIWNEPEIDNCDLRPPENPRCWGGTTTNFFRFYETAAKHLKTTFPALRIGGPGLASREGWAARFITWCRDRDVPLDFFSWHVYARDPQKVIGRARRIRKLLDDRGFVKTESILDEWNYVKGWVDDWLYTRRVESGDLVLKGSAFAAAVMTECQSIPVDMLMYYDARPKGMNGLFEDVTLWPMKGYYPFYAWAKLLDRGTQVGCEVAQTKSGGFRAVAAKGADGSGAVLVVRYSDDDNVSDIGTVTLRVPGRDLSGARCHLTDVIRSYTEVPLEPADDGAVTLQMMPLSFALIEF